MNVDSLLRKYFSDRDSSPMIEVFDDDNIYEVFTHIVKLLYGHADIEISVLQALHYCFYEILDNVLTHSGKKCGTAIQTYDDQHGRIKVLVADDGVGVAHSLRQNRLYADISEPEALRRCIKDAVTDGNGMGFGLFSTSLLVKHAGIVLEIVSGSSRLRYDGNSENIEDTEFWQGTIVYLELDARREINPNDVVDNRTDCAEQFNETFINEDFDDLW